MTNLDSIFKSRDITLPTKVRLVKGMVFPVVMYEYERLIYKPSTFSRSRKNYSDSRNHNHCEKNYLSNYLGLMTKYNVSNITCQTDFILRGGSKITAHGDCSYEIKRCLLLGRKVMTNLDSILKSQRHYFAYKGPCSQSYGFSSREQDNKKG